MGAMVLELSGRATSVLKLKDGVVLNSAVICKEHHELLLISDIGRILRLPVNEATLPLMGKLAQGPMTMRRLPGEELIGAIAPEQPQLLLMSSAGALVRINTSELRYGQRGDLGTIAVSLSNETDRLVGFSSLDDITGIVTNNGRHGRFDPNSLETVEPGAEFSDQLSLQKNETILELISTIHL